MLLACSGTRRRSSPTASCPRSAGGASCPTWATAPGRGRRRPRRLEQVIAHPLVALLVVVAVARRRRRGELGQLALLPLPGRAATRSSCARASCSASTGRCRSSGSRPSSCRARCWRGCIGLAQVVVQSAGGSDSHLRLSFLDLRPRRGAARAPARARRPLRRGGALRRRRRRRHPDAAPAGRAPQPAAVRHPGARGPQRPALRRDDPARVDDRPRGASWSRPCSAPGSAASGRSPSPACPPCSRSPSASPSSRVKELLTHGNFHLADTGTGVRVQEGLTDLRTTTIPLHRIQALELVQPLWWRPLGLVADPGQRRRRAGRRRRRRGPRDDPAAGRHARRRPPGAVRSWRPGLPHALWDARRPRRRPGPRLAPGVEPQPGPLDPLSWRRNAWTVDPSAVLLRSGRLTRRAVAVPHARVQSLTLRQGWLERRLRAGDRPGRAGPRAGRPGARAPRGRGRRGVPRRGLASGPASARRSARSGAPISCTRPFGVGGLDPAPAGNPRTREVMTP